jgi:hypothetical protein
MMRRLNGAEATTFTFNAQYRHHRAAEAPFPLVRTHREARLWAQASILSDA